MESVAKFDIDLARVVPMKASEGLAVVEVHAAVGHVQGIQRCGDALAEVLTDREIESCVLRQVITGIGLVNESVTEAGAVIDVGGSERPPRKADIPANVEGVALVVIEGKERSRRGKIRQAASDGQFTFGDLIGIGKMDLSAVS